ncbi:MAG: hypothetical protein QXE12_00645 [Conexivisphaerales archaeon]
MEKVAIAAIVSGLLSVALILTGSIAPYLEIQSQIYRTGPNVAYTPNSPYAIETFEIPPIQANRTIVLIATKSQEGNLTIQLINNNPNPKGIPQSFLFPMYDGNTTLSLRLSIEQPGKYIVIITSYGSTYTLYISGVWAALYQLKPLLVWGIVLLIASFALAYYSRIIQYRKRIYGETR